MHLACAQQQLTIFDRKIGGVLELARIKVSQEGVLQCPYILKGDPDDPENVWEPLN